MLFNLRITKQPKNLCIILLKKKFLRGRNIPFFMGMEISSSISIFINKKRQILISWKTNKYVERWRYFFIPELISSRKKVLDSYWYFFQIPWVCHDIDFSFPNRVRKTIVINSFIFSNIPIFRRKQFLLKNKQECIWTKPQIFVSLDQKVESQKTT